MYKLAHVWLYISSFMKIGSDFSELWGGGSKITVSHWQGQWLIQQLVLSYKPWYFYDMPPDWHDVFCTDYPPARRCSAIPYYSIYPTQIQATYYIIIL